LITAVKVGNKFFFGALTINEGFELWESDGPKEGTKLFMDINPNSEGSYPFIFSPGFNFLTGGSQPLFEGNKFFFMATTEAKGAELWVCDGTVAGTKMVKDINPFADSYPSNLTDVNGVVFFLANDGVQNNYQLWSSDGTEAGTKKLTNEPSVAGGPSFNSLTAAGGQLFFLNRLPNGNGKLWTSDGTADNTKPVSDDLLDQMTFTNYIIGVPDRLFITGFTYRYGYELYSAKIKEKSKRHNDNDLKEIPEIITDNRFEVTLFPNPAKTVSTLQFTGNVRNVTVSITDFSGKLVWKKSFTNTWQISLPMERLRAGLYSVTINNRLEIKAIKLVKR
jgi:ELWxxDGT repeat protein